MAVRDIGGTMSKARPILFMLPLLFFISAGGSDRSNNAKASFNWSLGLLHVQSGKMIQFTDSVKSASGDKFRIVISPASACYAYVVYANGEDVDVIYEGPIKNDETWYSGILELIPPGGQESFYVVVSQAEQQILAQKISELQQTPEPAQKEALINEIFRLQGEVSQLKETSSKPSILGGAARGSPDKNRGVEYSGLATYVKTIRIEH